MADHPRLPVVVALETTKGIFNFLSLHNPDVLILLSDILSRLRGCECVRSVPSCQSVHVRFRRQRPHFPFPLIGLFGLAVAEVAISIMSFACQATTKVVGFGGLRHWTGIKMRHGTLLKLFPAISNA